LLAIAFAVALWSVVAYAQNPTQSHNYALRMDTPVLPAGLVLVGDVPQVTFTAIGTADHLRAFDAQLRSNPGMLHISGNFSGTHVGKNNVPIHVNNADPTITIDAPSSVTVTLDDLGTTTVPVSIERVKALPPGFHELASATTLTPPSVRIDGPKSQLPDIQAVVLVDLDALVAPGFNQPYSVVVWDKNKKPLTKSMTVTPAQVTVKMVIQADAITVAKSVGFTLTGQPAAGYRVSNGHGAPEHPRRVGPARHRPDRHHRRQERRRKDRHHTAAGWGHHESENGPGARFHLAHPGSLSVAGTVTLRHPARFTKTAN
jgi:hypothetical protein